MKTPSTSLRFHWTMSAAGDHLRGAKSRKEVSGIPDMDRHVAFCKRAESCEIESLLTAFGFHRADPVTLATALGLQTEKVKFLVACRSGIFSPTFFVQQINSLSSIIGDRISINMVAGHSPEEFKYYGDHLDPGQRYDRTDEFLTICNDFWNSDEPVNFKGRYYHISNGRINTPYNQGKSSRPQVYMGGTSNRAFELAARHADCLLTLPDIPENMQDKIQPLIEQGTDVGLLVSIIARKDKEEAEKSAIDLIAGLDSRSRKVHLDFARRSVSQVFNSTIYNSLRDNHWLNSYLWNGAVPFLGAPAIAIVGSYAEVAEAMMQYKDIGISQFLLKGWPDIDEMGHFYNGVLPIVRKLEKRNSSLIKEISSI